MVMDRRRGAVAAVDILQRCIMQNLAHGRIRSSSECRSGACDVDHFIKLTDEPRSGLLGLKRSCRQQQWQHGQQQKQQQLPEGGHPSPERNPDPSREATTGFRSHMMANVHFGNVCMDSLANSPSALLHHGDQNARLVPFVENNTKLPLRNSIPRLMIPLLWRDFNIIKQGGPWR